MIFSELYGVYYQAVAEILKTALDHPITIQEIRNITDRCAFRESSVNIEKMLTEEKWQLLRSNGVTPIQNPPSMPLTLVQKQWLQAISLDPRIRLFQDDLIEFPDIEPLFTPEDIYIFDRYADGDDYEDEEYRKRFRLILDAVHNQYPLCIDMKKPNGEVSQIITKPRYLEYSEKDDKFRLIDFNGMTINLGRIQKCIRWNEAYKKEEQKEKRQVTFQLTNKRNALERVMMHFAHFEKQIARQTENQYLVTVVYDKADETEMVIRILSFGPMIKVTEPEAFTALIRERLKKQRSCGL